MTAQDQPDLRASDLERERTIDVLRVAAGEGRLTFEELADRIDEAARARTRGELALLTRDLPAASVLPAPAPTAPGAALEPPATQSSVFGDVCREGAWIEPPRSSWRSVFGDVVLDLREAQVNSTEVHVDAVRLRERIADRLLGREQRG
jgi:uncharacterized protein DUF1707